MKTISDKKIRIHTLLSTIVIVLGVFLAALKIYEDSEPGAIPLFLIFTGSVWHFITRSKLKKLRKSNL